MGNIDLNMSAEKSSHDFEEIEIHDNTQIRIVRKTGILRPANIDDTGILFFGVTTANTKLENLTYRVGITKVLIEWKDYQSESFGELIFRSENQNEFKHYLSFSKTPGLRVTEINLGSRKQLMEQKGRTEFKLAPLFENQTLEIANAILEFEFFNIR